MISNGPAGVIHDTAEDISNQLVHVMIVRIIDILLYFAFKGRLVPWLML